MVQNFHKFIIIRQNCLSNSSFTTHHSLSMEFTFLKEILTLAEKFETERLQPPNMVAFVQWLNKEALLPSNDLPTERGSADLDIAKYAIYMSRYAKFYTKHALNGSKLVTYDDFVYLIALLKYGEKTKTELIQFNIQEKAAGVEVIKRLIKNGFISQTNDEIDRRSKRLNISAVGKAEVYAVLEKMQTVAQLVGGNLTVAEKNTLVELLQKLNDFHQPVFEQEKSFDLTETHSSLILNQLPIL